MNSNAFTMDKTFSALLKNFNFFLISLNLLRANNSCKTDNSTVFSGGFLLYINSKCSRMNCRGCDYLFPQFYFTLFSHSVLFNSFQPHGLQHTRLPCPSLSLQVCSNSHPLSQGCYLTISSFATPFSFCFQSSQVSGSFPVTLLFTSGGQSTGAQSA